MSALADAWTDTSLWRDVVVIFFAQVVYVTVMTVRWILLLKGNRYPAAVISIFEVIVYVYTLRSRSFPTRQFTADYFLRPRIRLRTARRLQA